MTWVKLSLAILVSSGYTVSASDNGNGGRWVWSIGRMVFGGGRLTVLIQHHLIHHRCCMGLIPAPSF